MAATVGGGAALAAALLTGSIATGVAVALAAGGAVLAHRLVQLRRRLTEQAHALAVAEEAAEPARPPAAAAERDRTRFLANISHEIRTPMNGIIGMCFLALRTDLTETQRDYLTKIDDSAQSLLRVINDILDFSRLEAGSLTLDAARADPRAIVARAVAQAAPPARAKGLTVTLEADGSLPEAVVFDTVRVSQVLAILLSNAVKFTAAGGITVGLTATEAPAGEAADGAPVRLRLTVADTGIGMAPEVAAGLFQGIRQGDETTTRRYGGLGLGLAVAHRLVTLMGGTLAVDSSPGAGTRMIVDLPVAPAGATLPPQSPTAEAAAADPVAAPAPAPALAPGEVPAVAAPRPLKRAAQRRILLVEDNMVNREVALGFLEGAGDEILTAEDGRTALDILAATDTAFDIILMDVQMPGMTGIEATRLIRALPEWQAVPIVALTAYAGDRERERCLAAGMNDHLAKPFRAADLRAMRERWAPVARPAAVADGMAAPAAAGPGVDEAAALLRQLARELADGDVA
ncbi:response regulator, partial [Caenispirillum bisanense]|uniref:response regulator n=1 Tax=Caenispirillum bisanense TaxID=414052 RepID=UPI0031D345E1